MHAITISKIDGKPGQVYYPLNLTTIPTPTPKGTELLVKLSAAALNHRDLFIRQHLYPGVAFDVPLLADGVGTVISTGPEIPSSTASKWLNKRVIINPGAGWKDDEDGPAEHETYGTLGGTSSYRNGTLQEYMTIEASEVEETPEHLSDVEAAALPLTGLTAWRALVSKGGAKNSGPGKAVLVTGIGGGVALMALSFAVARGADVFVTSSSEEKIRRAVELGAKGGVNYREEKWERKLLGMLPGGKKSFDLVVDGAGGDVVEKGVRILKSGGVISTYGMTVGPKMPYLMQAVLKGLDVKGTFMGSRREFKEMVDFVKAHKIRPVVSRVVQGIDNLAGIDSLFDDMKKGSQFGKLVVEINSGGNESNNNSKL